MIMCRASWCWYSASTTPASSSPSFCHRCCAEIDGAIRRALLCMKVDTAGVAVRQQLHKEQGDLQRRWAVPGGWRHHLMCL